MASETDTREGLARYIKRLERKVRKGACTGMDRIALDNAKGAYSVRYNGWR